MKHKNYRNERSLGHFISIIIVICILYIYFNNNEISNLLNLILLVNIATTFLFPLFFKPFSNMLILLGEFIGKIVSPVIFFIIFIGLITPIGFFYRIFIYKSYREWIISSEGNEDDFENEF